MKVLFFLKKYLLLIKSNLKKYKDIFTKQYLYLYYHLVPQANR